MSQDTRVIAVVVDENGRVGALLPDVRWGIWLISIQGGRVVRKEVRRFPGADIFPPGYAGAMLRTSAIPMLSVRDFSPADLVGFMGGAQVLLARDFWPALIPQIGLYQIRCERTTHTDPEEAALDYARRAGSS